MNSVDIVTIIPRGAFFNCVPLLFCSQKGNICKRTATGKRIISDTRHAATDGNTRKRTATTECTLANCNHLRQIDRFQLCTSRESKISNCFHIWKRQTLEFVTSDIFLIIIIKESIIRNRLCTADS